MTMTHEVQQQNNDVLFALPEETSISRIDASAVAVLARSETESQLDAAHKYPRSVKRFVNEAITLATLSREIAEACIYALPRGGKVINGPSVRLAEICASAYGNLHVAARVLDAEEREIVSQGVAWDLEKNLRVSVEARRRITNKSGKRYDDDMITVTGNAAASIALRNAIFRVVPRAYVDMIYARVKSVAVGDAKTLAARRTELLERLMKIGVPRERILARVEKAAIEDVGLDEVETLIGLGTSIKNGDMTIDAAFPPLPGPASTTKKLEDDLLGKPAEKPAAAADAMPTQHEGVQTPASPPVASPEEREAAAAEAALAEKPAEPRDPALPDWANGATDPKQTPAEAKAAADVKRARDAAEKKA